MPSALSDFTTTKTKKIEIVMLYLRARRASLLREASVARPCGGTTSERYSLGDVEVLQEAAFALLGGRRGGELHRRRRRRSRRRGLLILQLRADEAARHAKAGRQALC